MKSKWKVTTNVVDGGRRIYGVYRIININEVDHSGNREVLEYYDNKEIAEKVAEELNASLATR